MIHNLIFAGGGTRGICYAQAIAELRKHVEIDLRVVKGTSIGALMAVMLTSRYSDEELIHLTDTVTMEELVRVNLFDVVYRWGLDSGQRLYDWIDAKIHAKTGRRHTTFAQLHEHSNIDLHVVATNLCTAEACRMSHATHPDMPVAKACQMSMALPPLFAPVYWDGAYFIDGGVMDNFPFEGCDPAESVGFRIDWNNAFELNSMERYFSRVVYVGLYRLSKVALDHASDAWRRQTISIDGGDVATINMRLTPGLRQGLNRRAVEAVRKWAASR